MSKLKTIEFKNFRVYGEQKFDIDTDRNIVLLYGYNGFGKTSFFDGIEWGFTGKLQRYELSAKEKNEYPMLKNNLVPDSEKGHVSIKLSDNTNMIREIKNRGASDYNQGIPYLQDEQLQKLFVKNDLADKICFGDNFNFSHLLSQELINSFVRSTSDVDRYKSIVRLFGLERYEKYNPHFKMMIEKINVSIEEINAKIKSKENSLLIENEKLKLTNEGIDPIIKRNELKIFLDEAQYTFNHLSDVNELENISTVFQRKEIETSQESKTISREMSEIAFIDRYFDVNEAKNEEIIKLKEKIQECENNITKITYCNDLQYVVHHYDIYKEWEEKKEEYLKLEKKFKELCQLLEHQFFKTDVFDAKIDYLSEIASGYKKEIEDYKGSRDLLKREQQGLESLKNLFNEKFGLEKNLLRTAREFLKENIHLKTCPVCQKSFDLDDTIEGLEKRLKSECTPMLSDIAERIEQKKTLVTNSKSFIKEQEEKLNGIIDGIKKNLENEKKDLEVKVEGIKRKSIIANQVLSILSTRKLSFNQDVLQKELSDIYKDIQEKEILLDAEHYRHLKSQYRQDISDIENETKTYNEYKVKYQVKEKESIARRATEKNERRGNIDILSFRYKKIIQLANELIQYYKNEALEAKIKDLQDEKEKLYREKNALLRMLEDYKSLLNSVRAVIETETTKTLNLYIESIRKFYNYLNPHAYLKSLNIRIDDTNKTNNRLILEVYSDKNRKLNPSYIFSSAQNNVLALSIFLSFAFSQNWSNLDFVCMDDPIQNMDDINVFSLVDIIRSLIKHTDKQIFISTHDDRVYHFMLKKFRGNVQTFKFLEYGIIEQKFC